MEDLQNWFSVTLCALWPEGEARFIREETLGTLRWEAIHVCILCYTDSVAMLQYCMLSYSDFTGVSFVYNKS